MSIIGKTAAICGTGAQQQSGGNVSAGGTLTSNAIVIGQGAQAVAVTTTGTGVLTAIGNTANATGGVVTVDGTATLTNKTLTTPVINGATSGSGNFDLSGSTGTFKTSTGAATFGGSANTFTNGLAANALVDISNASAGQIKFPATRNVSANANTLDDYATGTWTPVLNLWTNVGSPTVTGTYIAIGKLVFITCKIVPATTVSSSGGNSYISGIPFSLSAQIYVATYTDTAAVSYGTQPATSGLGAFYSPTIPATAATVIMNAVYMR